MSMVSEHVGRACVAVLTCGFAVSRPPASCETPSSMDPNALDSSVRAENVNNKTSSAQESTPNSAIMTQLKTLFDRAAANSNALASSEVALGLPKYMAKYSELLAKENPNASQRKSDTTKSKKMGKDRARVVLMFKPEEMAAHFDCAQHEAPFKHIRESLLQRK